MNPGPEESDLTRSDPHAGGAADLVALDPDHPGFRDREYRQRRNAIARQALEYRPGDPAPDTTYTDEEQGVWRTVWEHLAPLHAERACRVCRESFELLPIRTDRIPQFSELNPLIEQGTGFRMLPVAGLVSARTFLSYLGRDVFLATQYIRHHSTPLYTPEPDVVHELVGHAATLAHPRLARLSRAFGRAALDADEHRMRALELLYWYTLEFGVVEEDGRLKALGAGLLSSFGELGRLDEGPELRPFDIGTIVASEYDPTDYQGTLFVASGFESLESELLGWLGAS